MKEKTLREARDEAIRKGMIWVLHAGKLSYTLPACKEDIDMLIAERQLQDLGIDWIWR